MRDWKVGDQCVVKETNIEDSVHGIYKNRPGIIRDICGALDYRYDVEVDGALLWCKIEGGDEDICKELYKEIADEDKMIEKGPQLPEDRSGEPDQFHLDDLEIIEQMPTAVREMLKEGRFWGFVWGFIIGFAVAMTICYLLAEGA
jgi:hypothetical protein